MGLGNYYATLVWDNKNDAKTLSEVSGTSEEKIEEDLEFIQKADSDETFNYEAYVFLYDLEQILRNIIQQRIIEPNEKNMTNLIPLDIITECKAKQDEEKKNGFVVSSDRWIDYSDFTHLEMILKKGRNREKLKDIINDQEFGSVVSKLHELDPIRKKIAHSRPLTLDEFNRIRMYGEDIIKLFSKFNKGRFNDLTDGFSIGSFPH